MAAAVERNSVLAAALTSTTNTAVRRMQTVTRSTWGINAGLIAIITAYPGHVAQRRRNSGQATLTSLPRSTLPGESGVIRNSRQVPPSRSALTSPAAKLGANKIRRATCSSTRLPPTTSIPPAEGAGQGHVTVQARERMALTAISRRVQ